LAKSARVQADYAQALSLLEEAAKIGSPEAHYAIGTWYLFGRGVRKDSGKAARYLRHAAARGIPAAQFDLAILFETGRGVAKDPERAFKLYLEAATNGDRDGLNSVIRCVYHGIGIAASKGLARLLQDFSEAKVSLEKKERLHQPGSIKRRSTRSERRKPQ
jgi:TPR repeat protein